MADKITYTDKVDSRVAGSDPTKEIVAGDMNQIKSSYNGLVDELGLGTSDDNAWIVTGKLSYCKKILSDSYHQLQSLL